MRRQVRMDIHVIQQNENAAYSRVHMHTHACACDMRTHAYICTRVCACTRVCMHARAHVHATLHARTHIFTYAHIHCSSKSPLSAALAVGYVHSFCAVAGLISLIAGQKPRWYILHSHIRNVLVVFAYYLCDGCESKVCFGFVCVCGLG